MSGEYGAREEKARTEEEYHADESQSEIQSDQEVTQPDSPSNEIEETYPWTPAAEATFQTVTQPWSFPYQPAAQCTCATYVEPYQVSTHNYNFIAKMPVRYETWASDENSMIMPISTVPTEDNLDQSIKIDERRSQKSSFFKLVRFSKCDKHFLDTNVQRDSWVYEFPHELCGRLIGKGGRNIRTIMEQSGTYLTLCEVGDNDPLQLLKICGLDYQILEAVKIIENKFCFASASNISESKIVPLHQKNDESFVIRQLQLSSTEETNVVLANVVNAGHFYLHITHMTTDTFMEGFKSQLLKCYDKSHIPKLDRNPVAGTYCVAMVDNCWYRAQLIDNFKQAKKAEALLVDYGIHVMLPLDAFRQIR